MNLSEGQVKDLASPLVGIVAEFYQDPKNEEDFQQWLLQQNESADESSQ